MSHTATALVRAAYFLLLCSLLVLSSPQVQATVTEPVTQPEILEPALRVFVERFRTAFERRDSSLARRLFHWEGVNARDTEMVSRMIQSDLDKRLAGLRVYAVDREEERVVRRNMNLRVVAELLARFVDDRGRVHYSLHQLGMSEGHFFIALGRSFHPGAIVI